MYWVTMDNTSPMTQFMRVNVHVCYSFALHTLLSALRRYSLSAGQAKVNKSMI